MPSRPRQLFAGLSLALLALTPAALADHQPIILSLESKAKASVSSSGNPNSRAHALRGADRPAAAETSMDVSQPLAYFAKLTFPGDQEISVIVDTGSANLLVKGATLHDPKALDVTKAEGGFLTCEDPRCQGSCSATKSIKMEGKEVQTTCGPNGGTCMVSNEFRAAFRIAEATDIPETVCLFEDLYMDGSGAEGMNAFGPVELAGLTANSTYGVIVKASLDFYEKKDGGGIMGMAFSGNGMECNQFSCFPSLFDDLVAQHNLSDVFAICGSRTNPVMTLGGGDERLYNGTLNFANLLEPYADYRVQTSAVSLGDLTLQPEELAPTIIDTGTSDLVLPKDMLSKIKEHFQSNYCIFPGMCSTRGDDTLWDGACVPWKRGRDTGLPDITFTLGDSVTVAVGPDQYLPEQKVNGKTQRCMRLFEGDDSIIFGESVLSNYYVEFDRANKRVGFAPAVGDCGAALQA